MSVESIQIDAFNTNLHSCRILCQGPFPHHKYPPIMESIQKLREPFKKKILLSHAAFSMSKHLPLQSDAGVPQANLEDSWIEQMLNVGHIRRISRKEIRGWVRMFPVAEHAKQRFRLIKYTKWANDFYGKDCLRKLVMPSKVDIVRLVRDGSHFIMLDFSARYLSQ